MKANTGIPRRRGRAQYRNMSEFTWGRMIGLLEAGLSYRDISTCTGHSATTVMCTCNQSIEGGRTQRRGVTVSCNVTTSLHHRNLFRMSMQLACNCLRQRFVAVFRGLI